MGRFAVALVTPRVAFSKCRMYSCANAVELKRRTCRIAKSIETTQLSSSTAKVCKRNFLPGKTAGLGFRRCDCGSAMRGLRLDDPQSYFAQTVIIVALDSPALDSWRSNKRFDLFLAAAALELPCHKKR